MEKRTRLQKLLLIGVVLLTFYNILPTVFFYSKPLKEPVNAKQAEKISLSIMERINGIEGDSKEWLSSYCKLLNLKPQNIHFDAQEPQKFSITFKDGSDALKFRKFLPRSGSLIASIPSQLSILQGAPNGSNTVEVQRKIPIHFAKNDQESYFQFAEKFDEQKSPTPLYRSLVFDRALQLGMAVGGPHANGQQVLSILAQENLSTKIERTLQLANSLLSFTNTFGETSGVARSYFASFSAVDVENRSTLIQNFLATLEQAKDQVRLERIQIRAEATALQSEGSFLETAKQQRLEALEVQEETLLKAESLVKRNKSAFAAGAKPWKQEALSKQLEQTYYLAREKGSDLQTISLEGRNPFIEEMVIDWNNETIELVVSPSFITAKAKLNPYTKENADQLLYNEIAYDSRVSGEKISPKSGNFFVKLSEIEGSQSFLMLNLAPIAASRIDEVKNNLQTYWNPKHPDLQRDVFPIWTEKEYASLPAHEKKLGLLLHAPIQEAGMAKTGLNNSSIYVIAKGLDQILQKLQAAPNSEDAKSFFADFNQLKGLLQQSGFFGYPGSTIQISREFAADFIFEAEEFYLPVLKASRENFTLHGTKRHAILEFSNMQQRILTENKIENQIHEDLLKWRDDYHAAQVGAGGASPLDVPKHTESTFLSNLKLSLKKYFRGDDRKVLNWGLDLSGGKTVQIALHDQSGKPVVGDMELKQGIEELYNRVNKMGVSEVSIRREGNLITLDFPGSQELSASELIKASTMYFHIVNEKFNEKNPSLAATSNQFLQEVWNEAVVTGRKSAEEINQIAWRHIHGDSTNAEMIHPRSEAARTLYESGLRLSGPYQEGKNNLFSDAVSEIAILRGDDFTEWQGKTHPLVIVFRNFAVEGSNLKNVQGGYDQNKGNFLAFEIKGKETLPSGEKINPREDLFSWTSQFSKDKIAGTPNAALSSNMGWRMAVILNGTVITAPTLSYPIRDGGSIEGSFTQREINQLEADLKAGSLSYTPRILSEKNVSPELGAKERNFGIMATMIALALVIGCMVLYYRFGGFIASIAVIFNLLIMWAVLQNLGATLTLASIAGAILTLGMAVDANVLVFERIREEFALCGRLAPSVHAGYRKAFSAILDSNVTTIIAALILLQFDSGPIKGFAVTLIVGIASSMFTALFMTRFFFTGWVQNPKHTKLTMSKLIKAVKFPFLKYGKLAFGASAVIILLGGYAFVQKSHSIMGMDFTGGYSLNLELKKQPEAQYRVSVEKALTRAGISSQDFQVQELSPSNQIRLFLSKNLQQEGNPFFGMPMQTEVDGAIYGYETNPRIQWVVTSLESAGVALSPDSLETLEHNWSEISGQLSNAMRNSALIGLGVAILCILVYITIRFEFSYAISATLCLAHDIAITLGAIALLHALRVPIQIDLNTVAALMTIVGYSLNDTIIVFDRIREDLRLVKKATFIEVVHHALNVTLSRTIMTSITTLLVLLPLVFLGGSTIFAFSLVMILGVVFGTLSSLFIAAPMLAFFHARQKQKEKGVVQVVR